MKEQISQRLQENIGRVKNLVDIYQTHLQGTGSGRRGSLETDVLRAATVFLHASLEDFLRSLSYWKLPDAKKDVIDKIPLLGSKGNASKFFLGELVAHKGKSVDTLIKESVDQYLERSNYNNIEEIISLLASIGVDSAKIRTEVTALVDIMNRRHQIVHRADIDNTCGQGNHRVKSISVTLVNKWIETVELFAEAALNEITA